MCHPPACQISTARRLEVDDDVSDLQVSLFLQMSQNSSSEENLTLTNTEKVGVQLQGVDLFRAQETFELHKPPGEAHGPALQGRTSSP